MVVRRSAARDALALVVAVSALALGGGSAFAQDDGGDPPPTGGTGGADAPVNEPAPPPLPPADEPAPGTSPAATGGSAASTGGPATSPSMAETEAEDRERRRDDDDEGDGRTADLLWIEAGIGYGFSDIVSFNNDNFLPGLEEKTSSGLAAHLAAGIRVFFLTLGARGTLGTSEAYDLWSIMFDAMLRLPIPVVEPYFRFGIGYAFLGRADYAQPTNSEAQVYGLAIEGGAGVDIYLANVFSIGAGFDFAFLNMTRQSVDSCTSGGMECNIGAVDFQETGDSAGFQIRATGHAALHF